MSKLHPYIKNVSFTPTLVLSRDKAKGFASMSDADTRITEYEADHPRAACEVRRYQSAMTGQAEGFFVHVSDSHTGEFEGWLTA